MGAPEDFLVDAQVVHREDDVLGGEILVEGTGNMGCKKDLFAVETPEDSPEQIIGDKDQVIWI